MNVARPVTDLLPIITHSLTPLSVLTLFDHGSRERVDGIKQPVMSNCPASVRFLPFSPVGHIPVSSNSGVSNDKMKQLLF